MTTQARPILPGLETGAADLPQDNQLEQARQKTLFHDVDSGKWYQQVSEGDWIEVPLDDAGLPMYEPVLPERKK